MHKKCICVCSKILLEAGVMSCLSLGLSLEFNLLAFSAVVEQTQRVHREAHHFLFQHVVSRKFTPQRTTNGSFTLRSRRPLTEKGSLRVFKMAHSQQALKEHHDKRGVNYYSNSSQNLN